MKVRITIVGVAGLFLLSFVVSGVSRTALAAQARSIWSGVYKTEQAASGEKIYYARCSSCHGDDLGGVERAPALAGPGFIDSWQGKDLRRLLDWVEAMPPSEPKSLSSTQATEVLAFLLQASEVPAGSTALPEDRAGLAEIMIERTKR
jgi:mono/diheme cytochrome c family protein